MMGPAIALSICAMSSPGPVAAMFWYCFYISFLFLYSFKFNNNHNNLKRLTMALGLSSCTAVGHSLIQVRSNTHCILLAKKIFIF